MRRNWVELLVLALVAGLAVSAHAAELREVGVRIDLTLQPLYAGSSIHWNFDIGGYALVALNEAWAVRASAGFDVLSAGPYVGVGVLRGLGAHIALEGDLVTQWSSGSPTPVTTASAGARFAGGAGSLRYQLAVFPASWTLASVAGAPATFAFSPSFTVDAGYALATGLEFGEAIAVTFLRVPSPALRPVVPVGSDWMLSTRLTSHLGFDVSSTP